MKNLIIAILVAITALATSNCYADSSIDKTNIKAKVTFKIGKEIYYLLEAERSPKGGTTKTIILEEGDNKGTKVMVIAACKSGCVPAIYTYQSEPSKTLGKKIYFNTAGIYIMQYDENSFVSVMPTKQLGKAPFDKFVFSNFYSKDAKKVKTITKAKAEAYAIRISKEILTPSKNVVSEGGNGVYSVATPVKFSGKAYPELEISFEKGAVQKIVTKLCDKCGTDSYIHMPEFSKLIGVDIYANSRSHLNQYIYVDKPGVLLWTRYKHGGLGKQLWEKYDYYNMFAMDKQVVRGLLNSEVQQKEIDIKVANWTKKIKNSEDKRRADEEKKGIDARRLPKAGLVDNSLKAQSLQAIKNWATKWAWKETITKTYFVGTDWSIRRNRLTGTQTGREIQGVVVMTRPDGLCSFQYILFAQEYDGSKYLTVYTDAIFGGQYKLKCEHAK